MEYTDYLVGKGTLESICADLEACCEKAIVVDTEETDLVPFVAIGDTDTLVKKWPWLLSVFDAEGGAWGFQLCVNGSQTGDATFGENSEWGIDRSMNGFDGDLEKTAEALGTTVSELEACFTDDGVDTFCGLVGFEHQYMLYPHESQMPDGVLLLSDLM